VGSWGESLSPGNEQRGYWGSRVADRLGSRNLIGIKNAAVDKLINRVVFVKSREELVAATRALDRVLLWNNYMVPQWTYGRCGRRAGTASPARRNFPNTAIRRFRPCGGGMRPRPRKPGAGSCDAILTFGRFVQRCGWGHDAAPDRTLVIEVRGDVTAVELHALDDFQLGLQ
jgi:hypothetical protein